MSTEYKTCVIFKHKRVPSSKVTDFFFDFFVAQIRNNLVSMYGKCICWLLNCVVLTDRLTKEFVLLFMGTPAIQKDYFVVFTNFIIPICDVKSQFNDGTKRRGATYSRNYNS